ncbi:tRNA lysidine(34) synthetase [Spirochaeta thermophila]|uniref:PP-loop domain protein n=1 Tax=Winmispira thermophila (strain ATCC 49972 / DSM 6192 / RI 19.B1) TaxID=665571 RepID=E0RR52_WINT6|nr:ATP-binding protein [Spirochaeta thermophila]ADN01630.1 PP-loop domain protein [Spirochaeta thermophila DSM 6192]
MNTTGFDHIRRLFEGPLPPWLTRLARKAGRGINRYGMLREGDRVLLGISGGKDSLVMALVLSLRRRWLPIHYHLEAVHLNWEEYPISDEESARLAAYFEAIDVPFTQITTTMFPGHYDGQFNCYLCARNRKRHLFTYMKEYDIPILALGHHLDDIVETTLINMAMRGRLFTMMPVQPFFGGLFTLIRPLCEVPESQVRTAVEKLGLPVVKPDCPYKDTNLRLRVKPLVEQLATLDPLAREKIYRSLLNIQPDYLPISLKTGHEYTTVEREGKDEGP